MPTHHPQSTCRGSRRIVAQKVSGDLRQWSRGPGHTSMARMSAMAMCQYGMYGHTIAKKGNIHADNA